MEKFVISKNDSGQRLDKYLTKSFPSLPKSIMYKGIRTKKIKVNRKRAEQAQFLCEGDVIDIFLPPVFLGKKTDDIDLSLINSDIIVVYEDENIILVNKKPGISCVPDEYNEKLILINQIKAYLYQKGEYNPRNELSFSPALCNRIDRNTGGIVIAAKNADTLRVINEKIRDHKINKKYLCIVHGDFNNEKKKDIIQAWMTKDTKNNLVTVYQNKPNYPNAKSMKTGYRVLASKNGLSLIEVELFTGRTHQIRAHMAFMGHPLLGDGKYSKNKDDRKMGYKYQALYSYKTTIENITYEIPKKDIWFIRELFPELIEK